MALVSLGGCQPTMLIGGILSVSGIPTTTTTATTLDAANEAVIYIGHMWWEDGGSHTVDTSGSSSLNWLTTTVTFANAGTTVKVGLADVVNAAGPPARAVNVSNVITFDVWKSYTGGGGGITANSNIQSVPDTGSKTIAHGDLIAFAVQMTARGGTDVVNVGRLPQPATTHRPLCTTFLGGTYAAASGVNCTIVASDGTRGYISGGIRTAQSGSVSFNSSSSPNERGSLIVPPFAGRALGIACAVDPDADLDLVLYGNPLSGSPTALRTVSVDANQMASSSVGLGEYWFASPYTFAANEQMAVIYKPTTTTSITVPRHTLPAAADQVSYPLGANGYGITRSGGSGAFASDTSGTMRYPISLIVDQVDHGARAAYRLGI